MSRRRRDRSPLGQGAARQRAQRRAHHAAHPGPAAEPLAETPLMKMLRPALRSDDPTAFWVVAAPLVTIIADPSDLSVALPDGVDQLDTFLEIDVAETTALLHMVAAMGPDEELRSRARLGLTARRQPMPPQITGLAEAQVTEAAAFGDEAGENLMAELVLPRGVRAVLVSYIEWSPAPYVKDAFVVAESMEWILDKYRELMAREGTVLDEMLETVTPADARARFTDALAATPADVEQSADFEQWPMLRPFVEFVVGRMPEGGTGYDEAGLPAHADAAAVPGRPPWLLEDGTDLVEEFTASEHAAALPHDERVQALVSALMVILVATFDDPLALDAETTAWLLTDVLPTSPVLADELAAEIPAVVPPLVAWSLERSGIGASQIAQTQRALAPLLEQFPQLRAAPHMRAQRLEEQVDLALEVSAELEDSTPLRMADLALRVGGFPALDELDADPLPAEELAVEEVATDLRDLAAEIDGHLVEGVAALLALTPREIDADEVLTACRRLLVRIAQLDDTVLRRKASPRNTAAALVSLIARGNDIMGYSPAPLHGKHLKQAFGLRSDPAQRARTLAEAAALPHRWTGIALADPGLLIGAARAEILRARDEAQPSA
ncbi:MAG TPA: hypothetical protein VK122_08390 [Brachybacterium sp.]|nr:hypothetical protein [Brachybacterium sp.]